MIELMKLGLVFGLAYSALASVIILFTGGRALEANHISLLVLYVVYLGGGALAGAAAYVAKRWVRGKLTAGIAGFIIAVPVLSLFAMAMYPSKAWLGFDTVVGVLFGAALLGPAAGIEFWKRPM